TDEDFIAPAVTPLNVEDEPWQNPTVPVPASNLQLPHLWGAEDEWPSLDVDEEFSLVLPVQVWPAAVARPIDDELVPPAAVLEEDFWLGVPGQAVKVRTLDLIAPWVDDDFATIQDEDHPVFWLPAPVVGFPSWQALRPACTIGSGEDVPTLTTPPI